MLDVIASAAKGLVVAPAGCGKTQTIVDLISTSKKRPCLILTHTTAGVAALKRRCSFRGIPNKSYKVNTIASWALNLVNKFPKTTNITIDLDNINYPELTKAVVIALTSGNLDSVIKASYSKLYVDEYQDCSELQHQLVVALSSILNVVVFGDPMQAIFDFGDDKLPSWESIVCKEFPEIAELNIPWRWKNAKNIELGQWLLFVREQLLAGNKVDLNVNVPGLQLYILSSNESLNREKRIRAHYQLVSSAGIEESVLVIGNSINHKSRHDFAKSINGLDVVEPVYLSELNILMNIEELEGMELLQQVLSFFSKLVTNINASTLFKRVASISAARNRVAPSSIEQVCVNIYNDGGKDNIARFIEELEDNINYKIYRTTLFYLVKSAVSIAISQPDKSIYEAACMIREKRRHSGEKKISSRAIGSTLLLKGLEAEHVLILDASDMNSKNHMSLFQEAANLLQSFQEVVFSVK